MRPKSQSSGRLSPSNFWKLAFIVWLVSMMSGVRVPVTFIGTWVHELGHGLGALATGGTFDRMIVSPDFSGVAYTTVSSPGAHAVVVLAGLLAPAIAGGLMLIIVRGLGLGRLALWILIAGLMVSGAVWAGDTFTRVTVLGTGLIIGFITVKTKPAFQMIAAQILAITFCLNAISHIDYFFMRDAVASDRPIITDTSVLVQVFGLPHFVWGIFLTLTSVGILYLSLKVSSALAPPEPASVLEDYNDDDVYFYRDYQR